MVEAVVWPVDTDVGASVVSERLVALVAEVALSVIALGLVSVETVLLSVRVAVLPVSRGVSLLLATDVGARVTPVVLEAALEVDSEVSVAEVALVLVD